MSDARSEQAKSADLLKRISRELSTTETTYIEQLEQLLTTYDEVLKNPTINPVQKAKLEEHLGHYRKILEVSQSLVKTGAFKIGALRDNELAGITTTQAFEPFEKLFNRVLMNETLFDAYAHIIAENDMMRAAFAELDKNLPKGSKFEDILLKKFPTNTSALDSFLILPVQRLPRYALLSSDFLKRAAAENFKAKAEMLHTESKKVTSRVNEVNAFANGFRSTGLSPEKSFALAMQLTSIPGLRKSFEETSADKFKMPESIKALTEFTVALQQYPSKKHDKLVALMQTRLNTLTAIQAQAFGDKATPLTLKQMQQQLRDIRAQIQKTSVDKDMKTAKTKVLADLLRLENAIARNMKENPKSANLTMQQTVYTEARKESQPLLLAKKHIENDGKTTAQNILSPLIEAMEKKKEKKLTPIIAQLKTQMKKGGGLDTAKSVLQILSDSKKIKSTSLRELIAEKKELVEALERQLGSSHIQSFKAQRDDIKTAKAAMPSPMQRNAGVRNIKQVAAQQPVPAAKTLSQQQKAHLAEARKRLSGQNSKTQTAAITAEKAAQKVEAATVPAKPAPAHARPANLVTQKAQAAKTASMRVQPDGNVKPPVKPQVPVMNSRMAKRISFFNEQHQKGITQPKRVIKKGAEAPQWPTTPKKGPGRTT